jgi:uncharacterized protein (TIGR03118 family)
MLPALGVIQQHLPAAGFTDVAGPGHGFVDVFDLSGNLLRRLVSGGPLNSPWGLAIAPSGFGLFGNDLLVGNLGDGRINAFDPSTGLIPHAEDQRKQNTWVQHSVRRTIHCSFGIGASRAGSGRSSHENS